MYEVAILKSDLTVYRVVLGYYTVDTFPLKSTESSSDVFPSPAPPPDLVPLISGSLLQRGSICKQYSCLISSVIINTHSNLAAGSLS